MLGLRLVSVLCLLLAVDLSMQQASTNAPPASGLKCFQCGGKDNKCDSMESLGAEVTCKAGSYTCLVAKSSDAVYRRCGNPVEVNLKCLMYYNKDLILYIDGVLTLLK
ncbi:uncharacterized protein LOC111700145 isoform X2 [Eurytemora carolleeae]|uniref:uncharacterized protein LOC111700145 isoform X2 n=1 Tax=Eurytemora carolleeae TaxID=1294199 RepID=UPI000C7919A9|nr:uncharacterized protein LOC111700145 isoform X2 [Eurytemora carolleeae]|eukprot:XP_023326733.1 uncharacterized protein LOC111700145 isoform X2 [Eurytemora affinis]